MRAILGQTILGIAVLSGTVTPTSRRPFVTRTPLERVEFSREAMGTTFSVTLVGADRGVLEAAAAAAFDEARRLDQLLSNYLPDSEWSGVNRLAASGPVEVSPELFQLLSACLAYSRQSEGAFDITVGPLMRTWGFFKAEGRLPRETEIAAARARVGYRHVELDPVRRTVRFDRTGVELDPGGIGKGYAVDRLVEVLRRRGLSAGFVSAGGSSLFGFGAPPGEPRGWPVNVRRPDDAHETAATVFLEDMSLSTSGSYERFFWANGRTYSHIMDPRTGRPARGASSVSVLAPRTLDSEAWTKPYFINGRAWTVRHLSAGSRVFFCDDAHPARCGWVLGAT